MRRDFAALEREIDEMSEEDLLNVLLIANEAMGHLDFTARAETLRTGLKSLLLPRRAGHLTSPDSGLPLP